MIQFDKNIKIIREKLKLDQAEFAKMLDLDSKQTISNWETGRRRPSYEHLEKLAEIGGVTIDWILYGRVMPPVEDCGCAPGDFESMQLRMADIEKKLNFLMNKNADLEIENQELKAENVRLRVEVSTLGEVLGGRSKMNG